MGGWGSGRRDGRDVTEDYLRLDIRRLHRSGVLAYRSWIGWQWTRNDEAFANIRLCPADGHITLSYRHRRNQQEWETEEYRIKITETICHFGGTRKWFICPIKGCGRRVAILYGGGIFACRRCQQLSYQSQREQGQDRALRKAQKVHVRLGGSGAVADGLPPKPTRMHWQTYNKLANEFENASAVMDRWIFSRFGCAGFGA